MKSIEIWYEFGSNYSYLSVMRIGDLARAHDIEVRWEPFLLGPVFKSLGWETSPFIVQELKGRYVWRDMERQCEKYGLAWTRPTVFPRRALLPMRVAAMCKETIWIEQFSKRMMTLNFVEDLDIDSPDVVATVLSELGLDALPIIERAQQPENKELLKAQTARAQALGIFGGPMFFVGQEMFWGNDRLDDAIALAARGKRPSLPADAFAFAARQIRCTLLCNTMRGTRVPPKTGRSQ